MKQFLFTAATALILTSAPAFADTLATVNGTNITTEQVKAFYDTSPAAQRGIPFDDVKDPIVEQLITTQLIDAKIKGEKFEDKAEVKQRLEQVRQDIVRDLWMQEQVEARLTDAYLKEKYDGFVETMKGEKEVKARHILVDSEDKAFELIKELDGGADFETVAKENSIGPSGANGGDLGYFSKGAMVPEFSKAAFALEKGEYTKAPIQTQFGWHVIKVEDTRDIEVPKFADLEPRIRAEASKEVLSEILADLQKDATITRSSN